MRSRMCCAFATSALPHRARREATRLACERRMMPSSITLRALAASVAPVVVMSTMIRCSRGGRAFGRAGAFDNAIVDDAMTAEESARQIDVFRGDAQPAIVLRAKRRRHVVEIGHAAHVDPSLRHGDHDIRMAEAEAFEQHNHFVGRGDYFADEVLAGDAEMGSTFRQSVGDLGRRKERDFDAIEPGNAATIVAGAARLHDIEAGAGKKRLGVFLQPSFEGTARTSALIVPSPHLRNRPPSPRSLQP